MKTTATTAIIARVCTLFLILSRSISSSHAGMISKSPKVFCFGDSLTAGTSPPHYEEFPYAKYLQDGLRTKPDLETSMVRWKGFPGWTSTTLLSDGGLPTIIDNILSSVGNLDLVIILAGTNDLAYEPEPQPIFDAITGIHKIAHTKGCNTIAMSIPRSAWQDQSESASLLANDVNSKLESWAGENESLVSYVPFPIQEFDRKSDFWSPDGLHFSKKGYEKIGESLVPHVASILYRLNQ